VRSIAEGPEWSYGWEEPGAQRMRFMLDFSYATGLLASELVGAALGDIRTDEHGDQWLHLVGKGNKPGKVALPPLARTALDQYLVQRGLPVTPAR
jgi:site-specific recombinase XerD